MIQHFDDIEFTVVAEVDGDYRCNFKVYEIAGADRNDRGEVVSRSWVRAGAVSRPDDVDSLDGAEVYLSGHIHADECSNWHFDEQDRILIHFCSKEQAENIGKLFGHLYEMASKLIPHWSGNG